MDELIDKLLREERVCDIQLPRLQVCDERVWIVWSIESQVEAMMIICLVRMNCEIEIHRLLLSFWDGKF